MNNLNTLLETLEISRKKFSLASLNEDVDDLAKLFNELRYRVSKLNGYKSSPDIMKVMELVSDVTKINSEISNKIDGIREDFNRESDIIELVTNGREELQLLLIIKKASILFDEYKVISNELMN